MLDSVDKMLLRVKTIEFYETPSVYHCSTTLCGGGGKLGIEKCEKSAIRSNNFGNDCSDMLAYYDRTARTTGVADASPAGLGAILVQCQGGMDKVVAYGHLFDRCGTLLLPDRVFSLGL